VKVLHASLFKHRLKQWSVSQNV